MTPHSRWLVQQSSSTEQLLQRFRQKFILEPMQIRHETLTFFDDFEWHLWRKGQLLASNNRGLVIRVDDKSMRFFEREPSPVFARDCKNDTLQRFLKQQIKNRRLFPMAELEVEFCHYAVRNKDLKKVCDLNIILTGYGTMVELKGLRGYDREYRQSLNFVLHHEPNELDYHIFRNSLNLLGIQPSDYRARPRFHLTPQLDSRDASALIAHKLWHNVRANEEGIKRDWDSEFLHQYRVALRRLRALFSQMSAAIGKEESRWFKNQLKQLAEHTGPLRDLDVYLAAEQDYRTLTPENLRPGLDPLFKALNRERQQEQRRLARYLDSGDYQSRISLLESRLTLFPQQITKKGSQPVAHTAARSIIRRYNSICLDALDISDHSPDEQVHDVRLGCKKLRYLLEFFADLFEKKQIKPLLKALKALQDNLGRFNDYSVQRERLEQYLRQHSVPADTEAAMHALGGILFNKQQEERARVRKQLDEFLKEGVRQSVDALMHSTPRQSRASGRTAK